MTPEVRGLFQGGDDVGPPPEPSRADTGGRGRHPEHDSLVIDCDRCSMRGIGCDDCVVSVLLGGPPTLDETEKHAIDVLAEAGLVPPLRMVESRPSREDRHLA
jgi:hypothetical protein